jgi:hypothetical protein
MAYKFTNTDNTIALRDDNAFISWSPVASDGPSDKGGSIYRQWKADGSPAPDSYVAPPPTAEEIRTAQFNNDIDRQTIVTNLQNKTPDQIKQWINNNATDLTTTKQMLLRLTLLVAKTLRD